MRKTLITILSVAVIAIIGVLVVLGLKDNASKSFNTYKEYKMSGNALSSFDLLMLKNSADYKANQLFSPLSLKYTLGMLNTATEGELHDKISTLLGDYKFNNYANNENIAIANALFIKDGFAIKDTFKNDVAKDFNAYVINDKFENADGMNNWIKENTFNMIDNAIGANMLDKDYILVNTLSIDTEWVNKFKLDNGLTGYSAKYDHEDVFEHVWPLDLGYEELTMNGKKSSGLKFFDLYNRYDIIKTLGENTIRDEVTNAYNAYLNDELKYTDNERYEAASSGLCENNLSTTEYVDQYISDLSKNYKKDYESTDFNYYVSDEVKLFSKDLKTYDGVALEYVLVMPTNESLDNFIKNINVTTLNNYLEKLNEKHIYEEGYVYKIKGIMPLIDLKDKVDVTKTLSDIGLGEIFVSGNLNNISKDAYIDTIEQSSVISVNNDGIKASTATVAGGAGGGDCGFHFTYKVPVKEVDLTFDKPFIYMVRDKSTKEVWYMGKLYNPTTLYDGGK